MNIAQLPEIGVETSSPPGVPVKHRRNVIVEDKVVVPAFVTDLASYRAWAHSDEYPQSGWISYLDGDIWVDMTMEELMTHNQVKFAFNVAVGVCLMQSPTGRFVVDRMLLTNPDADLSTEPDGLFYSWSTIKSGRLRRVAGKQEGVMELEGTPDFILEIVSKTSERKDTKVLRDLYWKAGVPEYWLVDARTQPERFDILRHAKQGYVETPASEGWLRSDVLDREFRLVRGTDPLGDPQFVVETR